MHPHAGSATGVAIADVRGAIDHARMLANMVFAVKLLGGRNDFFGRWKYAKDTRTWDLRGPASSA
jgi:hypothetical protein